MAAVADQLSIAFWDPTITPISPLVDGMLPADLATNQMVVCVAIDGDALLVATDNPLDDGNMAVVAQATGWKVRPCLATRADIAAAIAATYGPSAETGAFTSKTDLAPELHVNQILAKVVDARGSDLHLTAGRPPMVRIDGSLQSLDGFEELTPSVVRDLIYEILSQRLRERFENNLELDTAHVAPGIGRFRLNVFQQRDSIGAVFRTIPFEILSPEQLGLPRTVRQFVGFASGPRAGDRPDRFRQVDDPGRTH